MNVYESYTAVWFTHSRASRSNRKNYFISQKGNYVINCIPASGWNMAWTFTLALDAIMLFGTQSDVTSFSWVSRLTQAHPTGMVALAVVLTATHLWTSSAKSTNWTLLLTPVNNKRQKRLRPVICTCWGSVSAQNCLVLISSGDYDSF